MKIDPTLARLRALRSDLIDPTIAVHHGRVVKRIGDGILIEFSQCRRCCAQEAEMAGKNWPRGRGEALHLGNLKITKEFLDADYEIVNENLTRGDTRLLKVFSLLPKSSGKPSFHARVDDGSPDNPKEPELDIDINGVSDAAIVKDFKANRNGYLGHNNARTLNPNERIFDVEIATPNGKVFEGEVFFNVTFSVGSTMGIRSSLASTATVTRASRSARFRNSLKQLWQRITSLF